RLHPDGRGLLWVKLTNNPKNYLSTELVLSDWKTGKEQRKFQPIGPDATGLEFSPDGKLAFSGHWGGPDYSLGRSFRQAGASIRGAAQAEALRRTTVYFPQGL